MIRMKKKDVLLVRFFYRVKAQSPKLFYFFLGCCCLQLLLTVVKLEATPFLLYGMYSEKIMVPDTTVLTTIYLDDIALQKLPLSYRERDVLLTGIENYMAMKNNGSKDVLQTRVEARYLFFTNSPLYPFVSHKIYNPPASLTQLENWFKQKCSRLLGRDINNVRVVENRYVVDQATLSINFAGREQVAFF